MAWLHLNPLHSDNCPIIVTRKGLNQEGHGKHERAKAIASRLPGWQLTGARTLGSRGTDEGERSLSVITVRVLGNCKSEP